MRKSLCVAEEDDAAKGIADLLSGGRMRRAGRSPGGRDGDERLLPSGRPRRPGAGRRAPAATDGRLETEVMSSLFGELGSALRDGGSMARFETRNRRRTPPACSGA